MKEKIATQNCESGSIFYVLFTCPEQEDAGILWFVNTHSLSMTLTKEMRQVGNCQNVGTSVGTYKKARFSLKNVDFVYTIIFSLVTYLLSSMGPSSS